jgi:fatty-acyl-CoA synthase
MSHAAVIGVPDERWGERPLAVVVLHESSAADPIALREFLREQVPRWWVPERWAFLPQLPRTSVGKLDKKSLRARLRSEDAFAVVNLTETPITQEP